MKASKLLASIAIIAFLGLTSCSTDSVAEDAVDAIEVPVAPQAKQIEIEIMELINTHRISQGLSPLNDHNTVKAVAFTHTDYMIEENNVSHDNFFQRKQSLQLNANANIVSENVAYGFNSADSVVNAWLNSPSHRENIEGNFTDFDISAEKNNQGKWYFTNIFIKR
ncbi:MAG: CAP domain-containing protein [Winogradskyella sp.]|uniref:CAP domain-containing protein n=1 Tax=Winogradskyella sp. TaxID=1883156 RepID=UPI0025CC19DD|nr:CAP domain-containing protein [Winogradskyella sp.]NRB82627.1 CAP domain-containing protein [Winogradskyella sp.]